MNHAGLLAKTALTYADRPAVSKGTEVKRNYRELAGNAAAIAGGLRGRLGLKAGDRVALVMKNCVEYLECMYGVWHGGMTAVPVNAKLHPKEFHYILENSGSRVCFVTPDLLEAVRGIQGDLPDLKHVISVDDPAYAELLAGDPIGLVPVAQDDLAWLFYTSGTTGRPKGAMLTHRNLTVAVMNYYSDVEQVEPTDCMIHAAPMSHGSGLYATPQVARAANNIIPASGGYDVGETIELISHWTGCTFFFAPTMVTRLINAPGIEDVDFTNLKTIVYGGAPMYLEDVLKALDIFGPKLVQIYGQGEAPMTITGLPKRMFLDTDHPRYRERLASTGVARTDVEVKVVAEDGTDLPIGETGEVICTGDIVMVGYWNNPEATASSLRDGWLWTGDVGVFDEDGFLTLKDRSKDMIISGGTNIYPREIEEVILTHPRVFECAVVGRPHADWGEEVIAFVVPHDGAEVAASELDQLCLDNIARFKRPKEIRMVEALAKNNYGKILKTELRRIMAEETG